MEGAFENLKEVDDKFPLKEVNDDKEISKEEKVKVILIRPNRLALI